MSENSFDPLTGLPGQVESLRAENQRLRSENYSMHKDVEFLRALEAEGVNNWDGYYYARQTIK